MTASAFSETSDVAKVPHFVNGVCLYASGDRSSIISNPATGLRSAQVPLADAADVDVVLDAAQGALARWSGTTPLFRARVLFRFKELVEANAGKIAALISREHGKTLPDALGEVQRGLEVVEFACGIPHLIKGEFSPNVGTGVDSSSMRAPMGVCVGITPFNFPAMVPMWMFPVALACGNTFVLKPSERDPSTSVLLAELLTEAGAPAGVFNVLHGDKEAVELLVADRRVAAISFVGSTPVARWIYSTAAAHGKRVQALGGAKNHAVVMPDANLSATVDALIGAGYGSAGERCMSISAIVAVGQIADPLVALLAERAGNLAVAAGDVEGAEMGPLVTDEHRSRVSGYIKAGCDDGATLVLGRPCACILIAAGLFSRTNPVRSRGDVDVDLSRRDLRAGLEHGPPFLISRRRSTW